MCTPWRRMLYVFLAPEQGSSVGSRVQASLGSNRRDSGPGVC